jgi:hypothetical protein
LEAVPNLKNIEMAKQLKKLGHTIIIWSSFDGEQDYKGNFGKLMAEVGPRTFSDLAEFEIPYDEIIFGKPEVDLFIGRSVIDACVNPELDVGWIVKDTKGSIEGMVQARHFNQVEGIGDKHVIKTSSVDVLAGELFFYQNIPNDIKHLFPEPTRLEPDNGDGTSSITMTKVNGIVMSNLLTGFGLTKGRFELFFRALHEIHTSSGFSENLEASLPTAQQAATNLSPKVQKRFTQYEELYKSFDTEECPVVQLVPKLLEALKEYEGSGRIQPNLSKVIHGDTVFSNVILTDEDEVKFFDMRGALGGELFLGGDMAYDLSKTYQSLQGYDFMLLDWPIDEHVGKVLAELRETFEDCLARYYATVDLNDVKLITCSHFFGIVPLHDNRDHQVEYLHKAVELGKELGLC